MSNYTPSTTIRKLHKAGSLHPCKGLAALAALARGQHCARVYVDFGEGDREEVNQTTIRMAVHEVDMATVEFEVGGKYQGSILVIPENGEDWLSDYSANAFIEDLVKEARI